MYVLKFGLGILPLFAAAFLFTGWQFGTKYADNIWLVFLLAISMTVTCVLGFRAFFCRLVGVSVPLLCWLSCLSRYVFSFIGAFGASCFVCGMLGYNSETPLSLLLIPVGMGLFVSACLLLNDVKVVHDCLVRNAAHLYTPAKRQEVGLPG